MGCWWGWDLDPGGVELRVEANCRQRQVSNYDPRQSTVNKIFQSTGAEYFTELPPSSNWPPSSEALATWRAVSEITSGTDRVN